ncbi:MAG: hypothetical protein JWN52_5296 [Actinomycetia bacterium]|jgi:hypothetical protein|nr:hypothetical protein [Actinomycetes bacterium]
MGTDEPSFPQVSGTIVPLTGTNTLARRRLLIRGSGFESLRARLSMQLQRHCQPGTGRRGGGGSLMWPVDLQSTQTSPTAI